jgi:hypothetical protein
MIASMNNEYDAFEFATIAIRILLIIAAVAMLSCAMKSRLMFFAGLLGSFCGYIVPYSTGNRVSGDWHGIVLSHIEWRMEHVLNHGILGAILACGIIAAVQFYRNPKIQYSICAILLVTAAIALTIGTSQMEMWVPDD